MSHTWYNDHALACHSHKSSSHSQALQAWNLRGYDKYNILWSEWRKESPEEMYIRLNKYVLRRGQTRESQPNSNVLFLKHKNSPTVILGDPYKYLWAFVFFYNESLLFFIWNIHSTVPVFGV